MKVSKLLVILCWIITGFILIYSGLGLFFQGDGSPSTFTTVRGQMVEIYGRGIYRYDTIFFSAGFRGNDAVTISLELPPLVIAILLYRRGSLRGGFLLAGVLTYLLYNSFSLSTSASYNPLFLLYTATFSTCLFAFGILWAQIDRVTFLKQTLPKTPQRGATIYLIIAGTATALLWLSDILPSLLQDNPPALLGPYTTAITYFIDLGLITPLCILAGIWLLRRDMRGYPVGFILLYLFALIGVIVLGQTAFQISAGIVFSKGQLIGMIGSWVVMGSIAVGFVINMLRNLPKESFQEINYA